MKIAIDAMGGDEGINVTVKGSLLAIEELGVNMVLVGREELIEEELKKYEYDSRWNVIKQAIYLNENSQNPISNTLIKYEYDDKNQVTKIDTPDGFSQEFEYDDKWNVIVSKIISREKNGQSLVRYTHPK